MRSALREWCETGILQITTHPLRHYTKGWWQQTHRWGSCQDPGILARPTAGHPIPMPFPCLFTCECFTAHAFSSTHCPGPSGKGQQPMQVAVRVGREGWAGQSRVSRQLVRHIGECVGNGPWGLSAQHLPKKSGTSPDSITRSSNLLVIRHTASSWSWTSCQLAGVGDPKERRGTFCSDHIMLKDQVSTVREPAERTSYTMCVWPSIPSWYV